MYRIKRGPIAAPGGSVSFGSAVNNSTSGNVPWDTAYTVSGSNNYLVVGIITANPTSGVTYNSVSMTLISRATLSALVDINTELWGLVAPATGAHNVTITPTGPPGNQYAYAAGFNGVHQSVPLRTPVQDVHDTQDGVLTSCVVSSATGEMIVDIMATYNQIVTKSGSQTSIYNNNNVGSAESGGGSYQAGAASVTMGWSFGGGNQVREAIAVALKPA